ncbi:hypothetical protein RJ640_002894 [Escallonia rubra]|uniref:Uncharacterized protein n=1 Tax=Escallonia rubra TaxID=112253 RepID=A0AA88RER3_9ASTE|nr:hypothetical protein RJ640_002894 [Escallonia rubra]
MCFKEKKEEDLFAMPGTAEHYLADEDLVGVRPVNVGGVEEGDAAVDGVVDELDHLRLGLREFLDKVEYVLDMPYPKEPPLRAGEAAREAFDRFVGNDKLARSTLLPFMEPHLGIIYEEYKTAKEMFDAVTEAYGTASTTYIQLLIEKYNDTIMKEGESVVDHVNKLRDAVRDPFSEDFVERSGYTHEIKKPENQAMKPQHVMDSKEMLVVDAQDQPASKLGFEDFNLGENEGGKRSGDGRPRREKIS